MSTYSLVQRGVISVTSADVGTTKDATLSSAVKTGSTFVHATVRDRRRDVFVQSGTIAITDADVSPKDSAALGTAVDTAAAYVLATIREKRTNNFYGATVKLQSSTLVRATFGTVAAGDTIDVDFQVVEHKARRGVTVRLADASTVRAEWDTQLAAGETIDIAYEVYDIESVGDDLKEILFRLQRLLAIGGEYSIQDLMTYDQAGNPASYRVRTFDDADSLEAATIDIAVDSELEDGELSRHLVTLDWSTARNRPKSIVSELTHILTPTPGVN